MAVWVCRRGVRQGGHVFVARVDENEKKTL